MRHRKFFTMVLATIVSYIPYASYAQGEPTNFGMRVKGGPYKIPLDITNVSCKGTHTVEISVEKATWLKIIQTRVQVKENDVIENDVELNLKDVNPGEHKGMLKFTCTTCQGRCNLEPRNVPVIVYVVPKETSFDGIDNPGDKNFYGLVDDKPVEVCKLLQNVIEAIEKSKFGTASRGKQIVDKLKNEYLDNNCSDITFVPTIEEPDNKGRPQPKTPPIDGEAPKPDNAVYVKTARVMAVWTTAYSEEIYVGIDQTPSGIYCARQKPADYYMFTYKGVLGVVKRADLVHAIIHEGLHATQEGKQNVPRRNGNGVGTSVEEENDAFKAGDEACQALGLPPTGDSAGAGGYNAGSNPGYEPIK